MRTMTHFEAFGFVCLVIILCGAVFLARNIAPNSEGSPRDVAQTHRG